MGVRVRFSSGKKGWQIPICHSGHRPLLKAAVLPLPILKIGNPLLVQSGFDAPITRSI